MRFGRRDHEPFIGGYDPEHEMPNPDRDPRDRWQSDAYRRNAYDSRIAYRWAPDRIEERGGERPGEYRGGDYRGRFADRIQPRDRYESSGRPSHDYGRERDYGYDRDHDRDRSRSPYPPQIRYEGRDDFRDREYGAGYEADRTNRDNWSSSDFDRRWDYANRYGADRDRGLPPDRGYEHGRSAGTYNGMRDWDRRPDGERYPSDYGWSQSGREWSHDDDWDRKGRGRY
jgi:hypothetical protein